MPPTRDVAVGSTGMRSHLANLHLGGRTPTGQVHRNLAPAALYEYAIRHGEGVIADSGALAVVTKPHTGRSPRDKHTVDEPSVAGSIDWGPVNNPLSPASFERLRDDVYTFLETRELFIRDARAGEDPTVGMNIRIVTTSAWHDLFASNMFLAGSASSGTTDPDFTVYHAPDMKADPGRHGTASSTFVAVSFAERIVLIGGTLYAGEIKKSVFSVLNYLLPELGVFPMHCAANVGVDGDTSLFFGLSGTGKTTLSADANRRLIGDDEHGWGSDGIFNFEGGCYAKAIGLTPESEPEIYRATQSFGTVLENVVVDPVTRAVDFNDVSITENTRVSYPMAHIPDAEVPGRGGHPATVFFLTCDAFGVLPPISLLTLPQALYHFLSGYTAKVAGTERGVTEPRAAFSACFGAPFLPRHPRVYAGMLGEKLREHGSRVWLVNTGWTRGPHGVGTRIPLAHTRQMIRSVLEGSLDLQHTVTDPNFGLAIPTTVPGVPSEILVPRGTWPDPTEYDAAALHLTDMFRANFARYRSEVDTEVADAGPS